MRELIITKVSAECGFTIPLGISRIAVLGFCTSISRSIYRLKAIAAFLAVTIHPIINSRSLKLKCDSVKPIAIEKPAIAKGRAKIVWLNLTSDK
jgi:hypothetical protein